MARLLNMSLFALQNLSSVVPFYRELSSSIQARYHSVEQKKNLSITLFRCHLGEKVRMEVFKPQKFQHDHISL